MSLVEILKPDMDCWKLFFVATGKNSFWYKLIYISDWFITFVLLQELHILHEGVHVSHSGGEWHRPLLQLQNEVLWEGRTKQKQRYHLPGHWGLFTAGSGAWYCVVQGKITSFLFAVCTNNQHHFFYQFIFKWRGVRCRLNKGMCLSPETHHAHY